MHSLPSKTKKFIFKPVSFFGSQSFFAAFKSIQQGEIDSACSVLSK